MSDGGPWRGRREGDGRAPKTCVPVSRFEAGLSSQTDGRDGL